MHLNGEKPYSPVVDFLQVALRAELIQSQTLDEDRTSLPWEDGRDAPRKRIAASKSALDCFPYSWGSDDTEAVDGLQGCVANRLRHETLPRHPSHAAFLIILVLALPSEYFACIKQ